MPYGQRYFNSTNNGMSRGLFAGTQTVGNFVSGNFERPMYKIKGAIPYFDENRTMPLRIWEIVEINWKDFAQYIGPLQGFGWEFNPGLFDQKNNAQKEIDELKAEIEGDRNKVALEKTRLEKLTIDKAERQTLLDKFTAFPSTTMSVEDTHPSNLKGAPQQSKFESDNQYSTTIIALTAQVATTQTKIDDQNKVIDSLNKAITDNTSSLKTKEADFASKYSHLQDDILGLTDSFMHAVYTQFLKHFWGHNIGQTNPELWCNYVNSFFGNYLPMIYKAALVIANSKDFSTVQRQDGGATSNSTSTNTNDSETRGMGDTTNVGQSGSVAAVANTPQNRMAINARNAEFANQLSNQESTSQDGSSSTNFMDQKSNGSATNSLSSVNNGSQWQTDPLTIWNRVLMQNGFFLDLWAKAWDYGLFDATL